MAEYVCGSQWPALPCAIDDKMAHPGGIARRDSRCTNKWLVGYLACMSIDLLITSNAGMARDPHIYNILALIGYRGEGA